MMITKKEQYLKRMSKRMPVILRMWFMDPYILSIFLDRKMTREEIQVVLSGEGEDYALMFSLLTTVLAKISKQNIGQCHVEVFATKYLLEMPALTIDGLTKKLEELNAEEAEIVERRKKGLRCVDAYGRHVYYDHDGTLIK